MLHVNRLKSLKIPHLDLLSQKKMPTFAPLLEYRVMGN